MMAREGFPKVLEDELHFLNLAENGRGDLVFLDTQIFSLVRSYPMLESLISKTGLRHLANDVLSYFLTKI
jgi:hypothetical protein